MTRPLRVVHLPVYRDNAYQPLLLAALAERGIEVIDGGGGGTFLRTALTKWKADVIHFHWLHPYLLRPSAAGTLIRGLRLLFAVLLLRLVGTRVVWTLHNLQNHDRKHLGLERWLTRRFVKLCHRVIAHCPAAERLGRERFADRKADRWVVTPHGSYAGNYPDAVSREDARGRLGLGGDELVFLFFGRVQPYKGVLDLISAFQKAKIANARLVIAGKPADESADQLVRGAVAGSERISYRPGFVPDDEVQVLMRAADAVVLPFRDILTSGSLLLAMSFGKAVVAPALGCIPETIAAGHDLLYPLDNPNGLSAALRATHERAGGLAAIGEANYRRAVDATWSLVAEQTIATYTRYPR